jgi:Xaa-Pro aminopeptidase
MMGGWGHLDAPPAHADWEFPAAEYRRRVAGARARMAAAGLDCLFLTGEKNIRYLTGYHTQIFSVSPTRPRYVLLPLAAEPVAVWPHGSLPGLRRTSWLAECRTWPAPRPADDGVSLLLEALSGLVPPGGRIGAELGPELRLEMAAADFLRLRAALPDRAFVDAGPVLKPLRMVKSPEEVARVRRAAQLGSQGFARLVEGLAPGQTERDVYHRLHQILVELGADKVPYLVPISGPDGYDIVNSGPTDRALEAGDLVYIDLGLTWRAYFCDFNRNFAIRRTTDEFRRAYSVAFEATQAGIEAMRPGRAASDVWRAMAAVLDPGGRAENPSARMGHGVGLDMTEPPSLAPGDETILEEGMTLTVEPILVLPGKAGMDWRLHIHEENVVVTQAGCELLTTRAAPSLPVV